jgi:predicted aspartyl protease
VCFLKRAANQWTNFYAWAITGIKLSSPAPQRQAQFPQPRSPVGAPIEVSLIGEGGSFKVPVLINGAIELHFVVDSGSTHVVIPADVVMTLTRTGTLQQSDFLGEQTYVLADGSTVPSQTFRIRTLKVGNRIIEDIVGTVGDVRGPLLLGQSFLSRLGSWSIDNGRHVLILN